MADSERRVVVITGASGGIGAALARELGRRGDALALGARRQAELQHVADDMGALPVSTDVTERAQVERLRDRAIERYGHIDVWINNAGRAITRPVLELTDDDFDQIMAVNVKSALYGMQAITPHFMERGRGHIVNVSSFLGRVPLVAHRSAYNAAKAALNALTTNLRADLRQSHPGVHVSLVMPGVVSSDFARNALGGLLAWQRTGAAPPAAGAQTPEEVARIIADMLDHPQPELYTNPASAGIARRYFEDVAAFEAMTG